MAGLILIILGTVVAIIGAVRHAEALEKRGRK
jgi:hypothetical protein